MTGLVVVVVVLAAAAAGGLVWRRRNGVVREAPAARPDGSLERLGVGDGEVTMVQFSSAFCAPCRATRAVLAGVAETVPGVRHVEVDAESHLDEVRALKIMRTPTTLFIDRSGAEVGRASGTPRRADVLNALAPLVETPGPDLGTRS